MKCQREQDARKLSKEVILHLKKQCIKLRSDGKSNSEVAELLDINPSTASRWWSAYRKGKDIFKRKKPGRRKGSRKRLTPEEESRIIRKLVETTPRQLKFPFALWSREAVGRLIEHETGKFLPISTVGHYLQGWHFRAKKPIRRAYERKDGAVKKWMKEAYPNIREEARKEKAEIWWGDEMASVSLPSHILGYAPIGTHHKPILEHPARKVKINVISAITPSGKSLFALYDESINVDRFIDFMERILDSTDRKVYLILDNLKVHHAKKVTAWVKEHEDRIKLFYLPAYSPELNPDEYLNQDFKRNAHKNGIPKDQESLKQSTHSYLLSIQNDSEKVKGYFQHPKVQYAAA